MDGNLRTKFKVAPVLAVVGLLAGFLALPVGAVGAAAPQITTIAQGLDNPRGIAFATLHAPFTMARSESVPAGLSLPVADVISLGYA